MKTQKIPLGTFIESVKSEILDYQKKHEGEMALFEFEEVELEAAVGTTIDANGQVSVFAVQFGAKGEQAFTHKVRIRFKMTTQTRSFGHASGPAVTRVVPHGTAAAAETQKDPNIKQVPGLRPPLGS